VKITSTSIGPVALTGLSSLQSAPNVWSLGSKAVEPQLPVPTTFLPSRQSKRSRSLPDVAPDDVDRPEQQRESDQS